MNILIAANFYGAGGRETHVLKLCRELIAEGAEITVATRIAHRSTPFVKEAASMGVFLLATPFAVNHRWLKLSTLWALVFWPLVLRKRRFEVLYTFDLSRFTAFLQRFLTPDGRLILNRLGDPITKEEWRGKDLPRPDAIVVETKLQARAMTESATPGIPVIALPALGHYESSTACPNKCRERSLNVSYLGRFDANKGIERLLKIWPGLVNSDLTLTFYGLGDRKQLQKGIDEHNLTDRVLIKQSWQSSEELTAILRETDFIVLPSYSEGLPVILLEAMANGVPFVATDVGAIRTLGEDNPDVLIVANNDDAVKAGIDRMANCIRAGQIDSERLRQFHNRHYGFRKVSQRWRRVLLEGERFWETELAKQ